MKNLAMGLLLLSACGANAQGGTEQNVATEADAAGAVSAEAGASSIARAGSGAGGDTGGFVPVPPVPAAGATSVGAAGAAPVAMGGSASVAEAGAASVSVAGSGSTQGGSSGAVGIAGSSGSPAKQCSLDTMSNEGCADWTVGTTPRGAYNARSCSCGATNSCAGGIVRLISPAVGSGVQVFKCATCDDCKAATQAAVDFEYGK